MNHYNTSLDYVSHEEILKQKPKKVFKLHIQWRRSFFKALKSITVAVLILSLQIPYSLSFFSDSETSTGNVFASGKLDMGFTSHQPSFDPTALLKGKTATMSAMVDNLTGLPFKYKQSISGLDPQNELCNTLVLKAWYYRYSAPGVLQKNIKYNGNLTGFSINSLGNDPQMMIANNEPYISNTDYEINEHWFWYEVSLPSNADPSLGSLTCNFNLDTEAVQTNMNFGTGFWDRESLTSSVTTGTWAKVSGMKWNDIDKDGAKDADEAVLPDWTIFAGKQFDQFNVNSDGTGAESKILANGNNYVIRVSGTIQATSDIKSDAKYASLSPYSTWTDSVPGYLGNGAQFLDLKTDNSIPEWGSYQNDHEYWTTYTGTGNKLTFSINNQVLPSNSGSLQVTIFETIASDITDASGLYEIDLSNLSGQFIVGEQQKSDWTQTFPVKGFYAFSTPAIYENRNFGNVEIPPTPDIKKLVINEVYYDVDQLHGSEGGSNNDEWVEIYNPNEFEISLKDWTLTDNSDTNTISHSNKYVPAHGFAVIAKDAQTWTYWTIPSSAEKIELGHQIGGGLANAGDRLILKNPDNIIIDQISWGTNNLVLNPSIINVSEGHSIARSPLGFDTDQACDWVNLVTPNPGTNPHSHIQVNLNQEGNNLLLSFSNAYGFDLVKYLITYSHLYQGTYIQEAIEGNKAKQLDDLQLILNPFYLGTCSSLGEVCVPHTSIKDMNLTLEYFDGANTLGTSEINYGWK